MKSTSNFSCNKKAGVTLPVYHHIQNCVQTVLGKKARDPKEKLVTCEVAEVMRKLQDEMWPDDEVESYLTRAEAKIKGQTTLKQYFSVVPKTRDPKPKTSTSEASSQKAPERKVESGRVRGGGSINLALLCESLSMPGGSLLKDRYTSANIMNLMAAGLPKLITATNSMAVQEDNIVKFRKRISRFKEVKRGYTETEVKLKESLKHLVDLHKEKSAIGQVDTETEMEEMIQIIGEIKTAGSKVEENIRALRKSLKPFRRELKKRLGKHVNREICMTTLEMGRTVDWWQAMLELQDKFEVSEQAFDASHNNKDGEPEVMGLNWNTYQRVEAFLKYRTACSNDYTKLSDIAAACNVPQPLKPKLRKAMLEHLPVSELVFGNNHVILDTQKLRSDPELLVKVIGLLKTRVKRVINMTKTTRQKVQRGGPRKERPARRFETKHPDTLRLVRDLVETGLGDHSGLEADLRRQTELGMASIRVPQIRAKLQEMKVYPLPSHSTIRRWMTAPNANVKAAGRYKGIIPARVPHKKNNRPIGGGHHPDSHTCAATVKLVAEWATKHQEHILFLSVDDKVRYCYHL